MKLYEYMAKEIFAENGIPTPKGTVIEKADDLKSIESFPVALKSQVLVGGRGKAGGIKFAKDAEEAKELLLAQNSKNVRTQVDNRKVVKILERAWKKEQDSFTFSDLGNAERFIHRHGDGLRYCQERWLIWEPVRL